MGNEYKNYADVLKLAINDALCEKIQNLEAVKDRGNYSIAYFSKLADNTDVVIKITKKRNSYPSEIWVYNEICKNGVPIPNLIFYTEKLKGINLPCLIISSIKGESLASKNILQEYEKSVYSEIGDIFSKIHKVKIDKFNYGYGGFNESPSVDSFYNWHLFLFESHNYIYSIKYLIRKNLINTKHKENLILIENLVANHVFRNVLNHGDLGPDHIFIRNQKVVGVIDPGNSFVGPAEYDLAYFAVYVNECQFKYVLAEYNGNINIEKIYIYMIVIAVHKAAKAHKLLDYRKMEYFIDVINNIILKI